MAKPLSERLSQEDIKFLMNLLREAEEEANTEFRMDGDKKVDAQLAIERINRIRSAVMDLNERSKK
ncbi:MAG: hypothetical protein WA941_17505 [Nitrososphaeraceae archaeon]